MNRFTIEYLADGSRNLSRQLTEAALEVLERNHAQYTAISHREDTREGLKTFAFMERR